jgi:hypothetical protein
MSKSCGKCGGRMEQGFTLEYTSRGAYRPLRWFEGQPTKRWWGYATKGKRHLEVQTWRCARCNVLESYASAT